jgi:hypothetical protein
VCHHISNSVYLASLSTQAGIPPRACCVARDKVLYFSCVYSRSLPVCRLWLGATYRSVCQFNKNVVIITYVLTPWNRVLLEKLTGSQLVEEIPCILWNPKVHCRIHKCPPPVLMMSQLDPVHTHTSHFLKIHLNIILPSTPRSSKWSLSLSLTHQNPVYTSPLHALHAPPIFS